MITFDEFNQLVGLDRIELAERRYETMPITGS